MARSTVRFIGFFSALAGLFIYPTTVSASASVLPTSTGLTRSMQDLVGVPGGPPGVLTLIQKGQRVTFLTAGVADRTSRQRITQRDFMRLASVSKAYNGAVVLSLVNQAQLSLAATLGTLLPATNPAWNRVTVRELLDHTSGIPDYTKDPAFIAAFSADPLRSFTPQQLVDYVSATRLLFSPGARYEYSDTENILLGLIVQSVTGETYESELSAVLSPLRLPDTSLPNTPAIGAPTLRGYAVENGATTEDVTTAINPAGAWASGGMVSTPSELNTFMRAYVGGSLFRQAVRQAQFRFVPGNSGPPGPGTNAAGLGIFRYRTRCGTVYGHTGNFPGYTMFSAASAGGTRSVVVAVNTQLNDKSPVSRAFTQLRNLELQAVCVALQA